MVKSLIFLFSLSFCLCAEDILLCTEEFCETYLEKNTCAPVPAACKIQNSTHNGVFYPSPSICNCCEYCVENLEQGASCTTGEGSKITTMCGDGLTCTKAITTSTCQRKSDTKCLKAQLKYDLDRKLGTVGNMQVRPECDRNGLYKPYICVPGEICYCLSENGDRIFGEVPFTSTPELILKCECSRSYHKAIEIRDRPLHHDEFMRCQSNGDFDALQCMNDLCLCVNAKDGLPATAKEDAVNINQISLETLPCFDNKTHMEGAYYRRCEGSYMEELHLIDTYEKTGNDVFGYELPKCQLDGYYGSVQENSTWKYCVDPHGIILEDYVVIKSNPLALSMNCKCARATSIMILGDKPKCQKNGNYENIQCRKDECRCVDENGLQVGKEVNQSDKEKLKCN